MAVLALVTMIWQVLNILLLLFAGVVLGICLHTVRQFLCRLLHLPRWAGIILVILTSISTLALFLIVVTPTLVDQLKTLGVTVQKGWNELNHYLASTGWGSGVVESLESMTGEASLTWLSEQGVWGGLSTLFSTTFGALGSVLIVFLTAIYILVEPDLYFRGAVKLFPLDRRDRVREVAERVAHVLRWWMVGQLCSMTVLGILMTIGLWLLGVPLALAIGLFTALMTFIPNLGPIIAAIPALLMALTVSPSTALYTLFLVVGIQNLEGALITPMIHRRIIALPPLLIIGVQFLLGSFAGFTGVLVAMPMVATFMVLVQELYIKDVLGDSDED